MFITEKATDVQLTNGMTGYTELGVDELSTNFNVSTVELLRELVLKGIKELEEKK